MKVFLSWSGHTSRRIADALRSWLPSVLAGIEPWFSPEDIEKGTRWSDALGRELAESEFGLLCVTPDNLNSRWLLFEAGAVGKFIDRSRVAPVLFDVDPGDVEGPLAQYQMTHLEKHDVRRLVGSLATAMGARPGNWPALFEATWPNLERALDSIARESPNEDEEDWAEDDDDEPDLDEDEILRFLGQLPDIEDRDWIDLDDVRSCLDVPTRKAEYYLEHLEELGLLEEGVEDGTWFLTRAGRKYVVEQGLLDE